MSLEQDLRQATADVAEELRGSLGPHLSYEQLLAHYRGELEGAAREATLEHLTLCRECRALRLALPGFEEDQPSPELLADGSDIDNPTAGRELGSLGERSQSGNASSRHWSLWAAAALVVVGFSTTLVLVSENRTLRSDLASKDHVLEELRHRSTQGRVNITLAELSPQGSHSVIRAPEHRDPIKTVSPFPDTGLLLILNTQGLESLPGFEVEVLNTDGERIFHSTDLRPHALYDQFTVELPAELSPAGSYDVYLYGLDAGARELIATYSLQVERQ